MLSYFIPFFNLTHFFPFHFWTNCFRLTGQISNILKIKMPVVASICTGSRAVFAEHVTALEEEGMILLPSRA